jgi:hypothetical protein
MTVAPNRNVQAVLTADVWALAEGGAEAELLGLIDTQHPGLSSPRDHDAYWFKN